MHQATQVFRFLSRQKLRNTETEISIKTLWSILTIYERVGKGKQLLLKPITIIIDQGIYRHASRGKPVLGCGFAHTPCVWSQIVPELADFGLRPRIDVYLFMFPLHNIHKERQLTIQDLLLKLETVLREKSKKQKDMFSQKFVYHFKSDKLSFVSCQISRFGQPLQ